MPLVAILLALLFALTGPVRTGQAHEVGRPSESPRPATDESRERASRVSALTRSLADGRLGIAERVTIAAARRQSLAELIEQDPAEALRQAMSPAERAALAPALQPLVESEESQEGTLEVLHADAADGSTYHYGLRTAAGHRLDLRFARGGPELLTGAQVRVRGVRVDQVMALAGSESVSVLAMAPLPGTLGERKVLVILLGFLNSPASALASASAAQTTMFGTGTSVSNFFRESSYQQTWLTGTVVGPLVIGMTSAGCNYNQIATLATQAAATVGGVVPSQYHHLVFQFPQNGCGWSGLGTVGGTPGRAWINGSLGKTVTSHELGHNLGLYHSHALDCGAATMGGSCSAIEYGDVFDVMGLGSGPTHFNAVQKDLLGWLDHGASPPITNVVASGTYTVDPLETPGTSPKALRVQTAAGDWLYVEYRRPIGFDAYLSGYPNVMNGVLVHLFDGSRDGIYLLDMTPATSSWNDPALAIGSTFEDVAGRVSITPISSDGTTATVNVILGSACTPAAPTVTVSPAQQAGSAGSTLAYTVTVRNNGAGCGASAFALQVVPPSGWTAALGSPTLTLAEGATGSTTLHVTSSAAAAATAYPVTISTSESGLSSSGSATYTVTAGTGGPPGTPGTVVDDFDRPDAAMLGNGWSAVVGSFGIVSGEARNAEVKLLHTAVRPEVSGATQTADATFGSAASNVAPRFGIVLRYGGPGRYYLCYRQVGGSSVLRIAKVIDGVETTLKSVSVTNPAAGSLFTLACSVNGSALTLSLDGVPKVAATDATLATGSVGFAMGGTKGRGGSHRATRFSATVQ